MMEEKGQVMAVGIMRARGKRPKGYGIEDTSWEWHAHGKCRDVARALHISYKT
jgi:hypothetical protein